MKGVSLIRSNARTTTTVTDLDVSGNLSGARFNYFELHPEDVKKLLHLSKANPEKISELFECWVGRFSTED